MQGSFHGSVPATCEGFSSESDACRDWQRGSRGAKLLEALVLSFQWQWRATFDSALQGHRDNKSLLTLKLLKPRRHRRVERDRNYQWTLEK